MDAALNEALSQAFEEGAVGALADAFAGERDDRRLLEDGADPVPLYAEPPLPGAVGLRKRWRCTSPAWPLGRVPPPGERVILDYAGETARPLPGAAVPGFGGVPGGPRRGEGLRPRPGEGPPGPPPPGGAGPGRGLGRPFPGGAGLRPGPAGGRCGATTATPSRTGWSPSAKR